RASGVVKGSGGASGEAGDHAAGAAGAQIGGRCGEDTPAVRLEVRANVADGRRQIRRGQGLEGDAEAAPRASARRHVAHRRRRLLEEPVARGDGEAADLADGGLLLHVDEGALLVAHAALLLEAELVELALVLALGGVALAAQPDALLVVLAREELLAHGLPAAPGLGDAAARFLEALLGEPVPPLAGAVGGGAAAGFYLGLDGELGLHERGLAGGGEGGAAGLALRPAHG